MVCGGLDGRGVWGRMDTCICMAEFLCYLPETVKTWLMGFPSGSDSKESACTGTWVQSLCREDPLEKGTAAHSSILAWRIPWTEEPGGLQSMRSQRVGPD